MSYFALVSTACCGFYILQGFGSSPNEKALSQEGLRDLGKTASEHFEEKFSEFKKQLDGRGGNRLLVANLIDSQYSWFPVLEKAGFVKVARFRNSNSGNYITTFAYHENTESWPANIAALPVEETGEYPLVKGSPLFFTDGTPVDMETVRWRSSDGMVRVYVPGIKELAGEYWFDLADGKFNGHSGSWELYPRLMHKKQAPKKLILEEFYGVRQSGTRVGPYSSSAAIAEDFPKITRHHIRKIYEDGSSIFEDIRS